MHFGKIIQLKLLRSQISISYQLLCASWPLGQSLPGTKRREHLFCSIPSQCCPWKVSGKVLRKMEVRPGPYRGCTVSKVNSWQEQNKSIQGSCQPLGRREKHSAAQKQILQCDLSGAEPLWGHLEQRGWWIFLLCLFCFVFSLASNLPVLRLASLQWFWLGRHRLSQVES